nr:oligoendopeptidase F [bacterium]
MDNGALPRRKDIDKSLTWRLEDMFETDAAWEQTFSEADAAIPALAALSGTLGAGADALARALDQYFALAFQVERLYVYAHMRRDEDNGVALYQGMSDRSEGLEVRFSSATAYLSPEILAIPEQTLAAWQRDVRALDVYRMFLNDITRGRAHTLSPAEEQLLALSGEIASTPKTAFTMLETLDMAFPTLQVDGQEIALSHGRFMLLMEHRDRAVREAAFKAYYDTFRGHINTIGSLYAGSVKADVFYARARKFNSALEASLFGDNVSPAVYDSLIAAVDDALPAMHRYVDIKSRLLGIDEAQMYDIYVPLVADFDIKMPYSKAKALVREALAPLGEEYISVLSGAFDAGWIDVPETQGKTTGAYSWGVYGTHPYVLLNHRDNLDSAFTLAHEMGHAMHSYYSNKNNPYPTAQYNILVAEVASTVNEVLLLEYMLARATDRRERMYLINHFLESVRGTVYRQTMFADFEKRTHAAQEAGQPLTVESMSDMYADLNRRYYGPRMHTGEDIAIEWARIPHFYNAFYVYKYATGFSSAVALVSAIQREGKPAVERYLRFLASGGSDYPLEELKAAGVDLTRPEPVADCLAKFADMLDELDALSRQG